MEKPSVAFDPLPNSLPFKGKRVLAAHPPSCHPRRMFSNQEKERKRKKMGEKEKNGSSGALILFAAKKRPSTVSGQGAFIANP